MKKRHIILASASSHRAKLLEQLGIPFEVVPSTYEEDMSLPLSPEDLAVHLSLGKASEVATRYTDHLIIGADTFTVLDGILLGKPKDEADALAMLHNSNGRVLQIVGGVTVIDSKSGQTESISYIELVHFKQASTAELEAYVATGEAMGKAGAFGMQGKAAVLVEKVEGEPSGVIGLPLCKLNNLLQKFDITIF